MLTGNRVKCYDFIRCIVLFCRENAEIAIDTFTTILQPDHLLLASSKRVKGVQAINVCYCCRTSYKVSCAPLGRNSSNLSLLICTRALS